MRLNRGFAVVVAILTIAPWAYVVFFLSYLMPKFTSFTTPGGPPPEEFHHLFDTVFRWHLGIMGLVLALTILYMVHLFRTDRVPADKKALWAVVLLLGNVLAMPVYWYFYMWPKQPEGAA